jgi:two-component system, NtrC family, sensor histidine kinase KinB
MNVSEIVREKQKSEAIIESIDDPLLLFDAGGRLLHLNRAAEELTGARHASALGHPLGQLFRAKLVRKNVERALEHAARTLTKPELVEEMVTAPPIVSIPLHGSMRHYRIRVGRILTNTPSTGIGNEPMAGILVLFTDITHFKELDQMKSDFIAKVSHEFRTPLTSMTMSLDILGDELIGRLNAEQHDIIGASKADARRLAKLIRDLLTLSRLESVTEVSRAAEEEIDVSATVEELLRSMRSLYLERGVVLTANEIVRGRFRISHEHFTSVLTNLLSNALKYTPMGGTVSIAAEWNAFEHELTLRVSDTGIGIAPENQKRIFEKFVQIKHRDMSTPGSVGLGLAIVREIAARYDGRVELESEVGKGSTFTVRFHLERIAEPEEVA